MICPNCAQAMEEVLVQSTAVDVCTKGCGGMFFNYRELEKAGRARKKDPMVLHEAGALAARYKKNLQCPFCKAKMNARRISRDIEVVVDACSHCGGLWLDKGEFDGICRAAEQGAPFPSGWKPMENKAASWMKNSQNSGALEFIADFSFDAVLDIFLGLLD